MRSTEAWCFSEGAAAAFITCLSSALEKMLHYFPGSTLKTGSMLRIRSLFFKISIVSRSFLVPAFW